MRHATMRWSVLKRHLTQERIVLAIAVALFILFSIILDKFLTAENILTLVRSVSVLGILGIGMMLVVIGRGIDLSIVAIMALSVAWTMPSPQSLVMHTACAAAHFVPPGQMMPLLQTSELGWPAQPVMTSATRMSFLSIRSAPGSKRRHHPA